MIRQLFNWFGTTIYIQVWENRLKLVDIRTKQVFDEQPLLAVDDRAKMSVVQFGNDASMEKVPNGEVLNPFFHPRVLVADFPVAEKLIQLAIKPLLGDKLITPAPAVIFHPMEKTEGGLTMIEERVFRELGAGAGARDVVVYEGPELSPYETDFKKLKQQVGSNNTSAEAPRRNIVYVLNLEYWSMRLQHD